MPRIVEPYVKVTERVRETPSLLNIDGSANIGGVVISPKGKSYQYISGPKDFLEKLVGADELPRNSHISLINAFYCSYFSGLVIARALNTNANAGVIIDLSTSTNIQYMNILGGTVLNSTAYVKFDIDTLLEEGSDWAIVINNTCFYHASESEYNKHIAPYYLAASNATAIYCESINDVIKGFNSWSGFNAYSGEDTQAEESDANIIVEFNDSIGANADQFIKIASTYYKRLATENFDAQTCIKTTGVDTYAAITRASDATLPENYLQISCTEASESNDFQVSFTKLNNPSASDDVYTLSLLRGENQQVFQVSLNPESHNQDGENCFIENFNQALSDLQFTVVRANDSINTFSTNTVTTRQFGASGVDLNASKSPAYFSSALNKLAEQSEFDIEYLSDFGVTDSEYIKDYVNIGKNNWWFTPVDLPYSYSNASAMSIFANGIANSNNVIIGGPFDKNTTFLGWPTKIAWSSLYYERVFSNRANGSEYAPVFESTNGVLNYHDPVYSLSETDRTYLLNGSSGPSNFVVYDQANNVYFANDNRCHTTDTNVMNEEMNRRMISKINKDAKRMLNRFKGTTNTASTRSSVEAILKNYMDNYIMSQNYKPEEYQIICDETNNPVELISANKLAVTLRVRLLGSIKFIEVLTDIFPLGVDFTN